VFNDVAIAIRDAQARRLVRRAAVIDVDLHQGNGTRRSSRRPTRLHVLDPRGAELPMVKPPSGPRRRARLGHRRRTVPGRLRRYVPEILDRHGPELSPTSPGADPYVHDQLGRLSRSRARAARAGPDRVRRSERGAGIPAVAFPRGRLRARVEDTVGIHADNDR